MRIIFDSLKPVYVQIAETIEDDIISGKLPEGGPAYSQLAISKELGVNPATAAKGINILVSKGVLDKQRGVSMTVAQGAVGKLLSERREKGFRELLKNLVSEALKIGLPESEVIGEIKKMYRNLEDRHYE